jgi:hypothetical protein
MASSGDLIDAVSDVLGMNRSTCSSVFRELRTAGLVTNEGRGRNAAAMTVRDAATYLLAICGAERVQDAADAVERYSGLVARTGPAAAGTVVTITPSWHDVASEFPRLAALPLGHVFMDAIVALLESFIQGSPDAIVHVNMRAPYPWAGVEIFTQRDGEPKTHVSIWYSDEGDEDGPGEGAVIDEAKARQRRRFVALGGDLSITSTISDATFAALGKLLHE